MSPQRYVVLSPADITKFRADLFRKCEGDEELTLIAEPEGSTPFDESAGFNLRYFSLWVQSVHPHTDDFLMIAQDKPTKEWVRITFTQGKVLIEVTG